MVLRELRKSSILFRIVSKALLDNLVVPIVLWRWLHWWPPISSKIWCPGWYWKSINDMIWAGNFVDKLLKPFISQKSSELKFFSIFCGICQSVKLDWLGNTAFFCKSLRGIEEKFLNEIFHWLQVYCFWGEKNEYSC